MQASLHKPAAGFLPVAELFMSSRALFPVETSGGLRVCVL